MTPMAPQEGDLVYDDNGAVAFIAKRTGQSIEVVWRLVVALDDFLYGMGIISPQDEGDRQRVNSVRALAPSIFTSDVIARRFVSFDREAEFVVRTTGMRACDVVAMIAENTAYQAEQGIVDPDAVSMYRDWSGPWVAQHAALNVDIENQR